MICKVEHCHISQVRSCYLEKCYHLWPCFLCGFWGHHLLWPFFPSSSFFSLGKGFLFGASVKLLSWVQLSNPMEISRQETGWVPPLKINANGPFLFSCWYPLIRWPHPLSFLAITRNWQLPNLQCRAWNPPQSIWPVHTTFCLMARPAEATSRNCEEGRGWCSAEGQDCKSHWSSEVWES